MIVRGVNVCYHTRGNCPMNTVPAIGDKEESLLCRYFLKRHPRPPSPVFVGQLPHVWRPAFKARVHVNMFAPNTAQNGRTNVLIEDFSDKTWLKPFRVDSYEGEVCGWRLFPRLSRLYSERAYLRTAWITTRFLI